MSCPACGCTHWTVERFVGGEHAATETRECQDCGYQWTVVLGR